MTGLHVVGFGATVQGHFEACALRRFWASLLPAAVVEVAVVICLKSLIRERTGHRSNALFAYEKTSEKKVSHVSALLGAETKTESKEEKLKCNRYEEKSSEGFSFLNAS